MKIAKTYVTHLENVTTAEDIKMVLDTKLNESSPQGVADYIGFTVDNIDASIERMKAAKKELDFRIKLAEQQKEIVKIGCAIWLTEAGVDKLNGDIVSSVSIYTPKPKETLKVLNEESLINQGYFKTVVDKTAVKNAIKDGVEVDGAEIEVLHDGDTLKINKRRAKPSVIETQEKISA